MKDREVEQLHELKVRFAYMFGTPVMGLDFYRGWLPDFITACEKIDAVLGEDKRGFRFVQAKEKHGWARYYFSTDRVRPMRLSIHDGNGLHELTTGLEDEHVIEKAIAAILTEAEKNSMGKCIVCGAPAEIRRFGGWLVCACEAHDPDKPGDPLARALLRP